MSTVFCYDMRIYKTDDNRYYSENWNDEVMKRYIQDEKLYFLCRIVNVQYEEILGKMSEITLDNIDFIDMGDVAGLKNLLFHKRKIFRLIKHYAEIADNIFIRVPSFGGIFAIKAVKELKKQYLVEVVGCPWDAFWNHSLRGKVIAPIMWFLTKKIVKEAPYVLYVSGEFLQRRYPTDGNFISGVSNVALVDADESVLVKRLNKIDNMSGPITLATVAAIDVKYKGQQYVIKAISKLKKEGYGFKYKLVGGGSKAYLESIAEKYGVLDCVEFCGNIPHDDVFDFLDEIDIYIQPSLQEGLPRAVIEAMSRGCPALSANTGGTPELLNPKYVFKRKSIKDICLKLKLILNEQELKCEAERSFIKAKEFECTKLEFKRNNFFEQFRQGK